MYLQFNAQIRKKDFIRLFFTLTLRKPAIIVSIILGLSLIVFVALNYLNFFKPGLLKNPLFMLFIGFSSVLYLFFGIYRSAVKNFTLHERLNQKLTYLLTEENISITGETFSNEFRWNACYKIERIGSDWIILYSSKNIANFLPISSLRKEEAGQLMEFLAAHKSAWATKISV